MATPVADRLAGIARLLAPAPGRLEFAARLALICVLTTLVVEYYKTPSPALTAYVAFFLIKPDRTLSVMVSIIMVVLISVIVAGLMGVAMAVADYPVRRVAAMALISFGLLFLASASKLKPIAAIVALITGYGLDLLGQVHFGELATRGILYAWLFIAIPAGVSIVVNLLIGPPPRRLLERTLAERLDLAAERLLCDDPGVRGRFAAALREAPGETPALLKAAGLERTSPAADLAALRQADRSTTALLVLIDLLVREARLDSDWRTALAATLAEMASILRRGRYPLEITLEPPEGRAPPIPAPTAAVLEEVRAILAVFAEPQDEPQIEPPPAPAAKPRQGFFVEDAFTNPVHVHYALRTTAAAMFCYIVYILLDWPAIHTCMITCYIVSLGTAGETVEKLGLRIAGCLIGAVAGLAAIVYVIPQITSIGALSVVIFLGALASGWVAAGGPRIGYAGLQIGFAFFLSVLQGPAPAFDLTIARDRAIGILFGNLVVYALATNLWPVSVAGRIDPAIAALIKRLGAIAREPLREHRAVLVGEAQEARSAIAQDIELAAYEPARLRPGGTWLADRRDALHEIAALEGPLLAGVEAPAARAGRLEAIAEGLVGQSGASAAGGVSDDPLDLRFSKLERALAPRPERTSAHAPA